MLNKKNKKSAAKITFLLFGQIANCINFAKCLINLILLNFLIIRRKYYIFLPIIFCIELTSLFNQNIFIGFLYSLLIVAFFLTIFHYKIKANFYKAFFLNRPIYNYEITIILNNLTTALLFYFLLQIATLTTYFANIIDKAAINFNLKQLIYIISLSFLSESTIIQKGKFIKFILIIITIVPFQKMQTSIIDDIIITFISIILIRKDIKKNILQDTVHN
jgi:hypothetical protein